MELDQIVQQLPVVIGDAVWRHLQKAKETSEAEVQLKGDLEISLPGLSISFSLYHTFSGESLTEEEVGDEKKKGAVDKDTAKNKTDSAVPNLNANQSEEDEVTSSAVAETEDDISKNEDKDEDEAEEKAEEPAPKKQTKKQPGKKRAHSQSEASESEESDLNLTDDEADESSDVEFCVPVDITPARSSKRLKIKAETLGKHDFSKGVKRIKNLKAKPKQNETSIPQTPVSSKTTDTKQSATENSVNEKNESQTTKVSVAGDGDAPEKKRSRAANESSPAVATEPIKKRSRGRPRKSETAVAVSPLVAVKVEPEPSKEDGNVENVEKANTPSSNKPNEISTEAAASNTDMQENDNTITEDNSYDPTLKVFACQICSKTFDRKASLKEHLFTHNRESEFMCDECKKPFSRWYKLKMHKILKHGASKNKGNLPERKRRAPRTSSVPSEKVASGANRDRPFACDVCGKGFLTKMRLHEHKFLHKEDSRFYCHMCLRRFSSFSKLERHLKMMHGQSVDVEYYKMLTEEILPPEGTSVIIKDQGETLVMRCNLCTEFEGSREDAVEHLKSHSDVYANVCEYCDKRFLYIPALKTHQSYLHLHEFRQECTVCHKKFARIEDLALHAKKEHETALEVPVSQRIPRRLKNKPFPCPHCDQTFQKKSRLNDHIWVKHDKKEKPFKCPLCDRRFIREDIMRDHMFVHDRKSRYVCETCGKVFKKKFELAQHRHLDDPWRCHICDKTFTTFNGYKLHIRKHTEVPSHMCRFCGAMFFFKGRLENHERSHTGEKPFECQVCSVRFSDLYVYNKHVKGHTVPDDSKHICTTCNRKFLYPAQLRAHMQVHSTPREKFGCTVCQKTYLKKESLRQHMKTHEDPEQEAQLYFQCEVCQLLYASAADCEKCKNNHYQTANAVAEGNLIEDGNVAVDGLVENAVMTQVDDNTQVLVVSLEDLEHLGHQFVIEQQDGDTQETVQHLILNPDINQAIEIAPNQRIQVVNASELMEHTGQELIEETSQELLEQEQSDQELIEQSDQQLIVEQSELVEPTKEEGEQPIVVQMQ